MHVGLINLPVPQHSRRIVLRPIISRQDGLLIGLLHQYKGTRDLLSQVGQFETSLFLQLKQILYPERQLYGRS